MDSTGIYPRFGHYQRGNLLYSLSSGVKTKNWMVMAGTANTPRIPGSGGCFPRSHRRHFFQIAWQRPTLPGACAPSTIGAGGLNFRVRDGNGWIPSAIVTRRFRDATLKTGYRTLSQSQKQLRRSPRPIRIRQLNVLPRVHLGPIYLVICKGSYSSMDGKSHLEGGFALRCFQRLSLPHLATQRCIWRHNWYTSGASIPVLSY